MWAVMAERHIMLVAGEVSGDALGADLIEALRAQSDVPLTISGVGGAQMNAQNFTSIFPMRDIAVMGLGAILPRLPFLLKRLDQTVQYALAQKPDIMVLIDSPEFNHRVAKRVKARNPDIVTICYVAPQIWAWRRGRGKKMRQFFDAVLALWPFEPDIFAACDGPPCYFVGHPLAHRFKHFESLPDFRQLHGLDKQPILLLLPGSRASEIRTLLPIFGKVVAALRHDMPDLQIVMPLVPHLADRVKNAAAAQFSALPLAPIFVQDEAERWAAYAAARAGLCASGTATLELGLAGVPSVGAYKVGPISSFIARGMKIPSVLLPNLILDAPIMPEFLQERCTPQHILPALRTLLTDDIINKNMRDNLQPLRGALQSAGGALESAGGAQAAQVARIILSHLG